jgi:hypothetical protein
MASYDFFAPCLGTWVPDAPSERAQFVTSLPWACDYNAQIHLARSDLPKVLGNIALRYAEALDADFDPNGAGSNNPPRSEYVVEGPDFDLNKIELGTGNLAWIGTALTELTAGWVADAGADDRNIDDAQNLDAGTHVTATGLHAGSTGTVLHDRPGGAAATIAQVHNSNGAVGAGSTSILSAGLARAISKQLDLANGTDENMLRLVCTDNGYENILAFCYDGCQNAAGTFSNFQQLMSGAYNAVGTDISYSTYTDATVAAPRSKNFGSGLLFNLITDNFTSSDAGTFTIDGDKVVLTDASGMKNSAGAVVTVTVHEIIAMEIDVKDQTTGASVSTTQVSPAAKGPAPAGDGTLTAKQVCVHCELIFDL